MENLRIAIQATDRIMIRKTCQVIITRPGTIVLVTRGSKTVSMNYIASFVCGSTTSSLLYRLYIRTTATVILMIW